VRRIFPWIYSALLIAIGVGFLIAAFAQSASAGPYENARECPDAASPNCFQLSSGTIRSVSIALTRSGEQDTTVIDTRGASVTVVLEPSTSQAPHVRTGAEVTVKWYEGKATLIQVDGIGVPSIDNPAAQQFNFQFYGLVLVALGGLSVLLRIWALRRKALRSALQGSASAPALRLEQSLLPTGRNGWIVKATLKSPALLAIGIGAAFLAFATVPRVLGDPTRAALVISLDIAIVGFGAIALAVYLRNSKVIGDGQQITRVDWLGRARSFPLADIRHVDRFTSGRNRYAIFAGRDGKQLFRVSGIYWDFDQLDSACRELGLHLVGGYDEVVGSLAIKKRAKASSNWGATILALAGLIAILAVFVIVQIGPSSR
jgi:hypothetical protein